MDHRVHLLKRPRGFSLVEMTIVLALCATLLTAFYSFVATQMMNAAEDGSEAVVQNGIRVTLNEVVHELEGARLLSLDSYANWVCYQVPEVGTSGSFKLAADASNNPVVSYGAYRFDDQSFVAGGYYQLRFIDHTDPSDTII